MTSRPLPSRGLMTRVSGAKNGCFYSSVRTPEAETKQNTGACGLGGKAFPAAREKDKAFRAISINI